MNYILLTSFLLTSLQDGGEKTALFDKDVNPQCAHLSRDGRTIALAGGAGGARKVGDWKILDLTEGKCLVNGLDGKLRCLGAWAVRLSPDNSFMAVGGNYNNFFLADAKTGALYWDLTNEGHVGVIKNLYFSPDNKHLISTANDMMIRVWDIKNKKPHAVFRFTSTNLNLNQWTSPEYKERAKLVYDVEGKYQYIHHCALSPDGKTLAIAGNLDRKVPLLDLATGKVLKEINIKQETAVSLEFTQDGEWLIVGGPMKDAMIEIWNIEKNELVTSFGKHVWSVSRLAISPDKKTVLSGGIKDGFRIWDVPSGKQKFSFFTKEDPRMPRIQVLSDGSKHVSKECRAASAAFLPDGKTFLIVPNWTLGRTEVYFHDTATGEPVDYRKRVAALPKIDDAPR